MVEKTPSVVITNQRCASCKKYHDFWLEDITKLDLTHRYTVICPETKDEYVIVRVEAGVRVTKQPPGAVEMKLVE
jgi:hypothetical protein